MTNPQNDNEAEALINAILSEYSGKKLLSFNAALRIDGYLLLHTSPEPIIKTIVSQRCTEDLISLFCLAIPALSIIIKNMPTVNTNYWVEKIGLIFYQDIYHESPPFEIFINSMQNYQKNMESITQLSTKFLKEYPSSEAFDIEKYISANPELLWYGTDSYMLSLIVAKTKDNAEEAIDLIKTIWIFREALVVIREKMTLADLLRLGDKELLKNKPTTE